MSELEVITENNLVQSLHFTVGAQAVEMIGPGKHNYFKPRKDSLESFFQPQFLVKTMPYMLGPAWDSYPPLPNYPGSRNNSGWISLGSFHPVYFVVHFSAQTT